jgi:hypothetical protein
MIAARAELSKVVDNAQIELFETHHPEVLRLTIEWLTRHLLTNDSMRANAAAVAESLARPQSLA